MARSAFVMRGLRVDVPPREPGPPPLPPPASELVPAEAAPRPPRAPTPPPRPLPRPRLTVPSALQRMSAWRHRTPVRNVPFNCRLLPLRHEWSEEDEEAVLAGGGLC